MRLSLVALLSCLMLAGCVTVEGQATTRFSNEFKCPEDSVTVEDIGGNGYRATGCGESATYVCRRTNGNEVTCIRQ
jgi:hypothetical protein